MGQKIKRRNLALFLAAAHRVGQYDLTRCGSGNLSYRVADGRMLISAAGAWLGELSGKQVAFCHIHDGKSINGVIPSIEIGFHVGILKARPEINAVLHFQSLYATTLACKKSFTPACLQVIPEVPYYLGSIGVVPYSAPGSPELAREVSSASKMHNVVMLRNHGLVTIGKDFQETLKRALFLELAAGIVLGAGDDVDILDDAAVKTLIRMRVDRSGVKP